MARLRIYTVHINPAKPHPYEAAEFVPESFSKMAFLFTALWAFYHRLWWQGVMLLVYNFVMLDMLTSGTLSHLGICIVDFGVRMALGFEANEWVRTGLKKRGYLIADITAGDSPLRAEQRFFDRYFAAHPGASA